MKRLSLIREEHHPPWINEPMIFFRSSDRLDHAVTTFAKIGILQSL